MAPTNTVSGPGLPLTKEELLDIMEEDIETTTVEAYSEGWICPECGNANLEEESECTDCGGRLCCA
jgi:hypothetical protein